MVFDYVSRWAAANIRQRRKELGLSASALADRCASLGAEWIDRSVISKIESASERRRITLDEAAVFAKALNTDLGSLVWIDPLAQPDPAPAPDAPERWLLNDVWQYDAMSAEAVLDLKRMLARMTAQVDKFLEDH
ncbi:helix-turn-helix transcriptional regulator [Solicola gregarius]|uniref:Helix-turn-helix transcriptional regulator n=2 Tax=Solicola gregarius TaxID=2908642 RepID=A0AA46TE48_9ACTN|nr:helix-turn-helix transcriptional regulator [Solicola gregarius]UYM03440.1 helix-turn-helix transcriptional regulator [Solicola gregarius]